MNAFWALVRRDLLRTAKSGSLWLPVIFFLLVATLYAFAVGPDPKMLAATVEAVSAWAVGAPASAC